MPAGRPLPPLLLAALICALPFAVLWWLVPFAGARTIGNDYLEYSIEQQMELRYAEAHGGFPLYAPGYAGGRSSAALTLGQPWHPQSHLAALGPGYWSGAALEWNTFWRLVSLGLTHLALFAALRRLGLAPDLALAASLLAVYDQRMLDMFRYGASLESYTGCLLLGAALLHARLEPSRRAPLLWIALATALTVAGGHAEVAAIALLGAALAALLVPGTVAALRPDLPADAASVRRYLASVVAGALAGVALSAASWLPFALEVLSDVPARAGAPYEASLAFVATPHKTLMSLVAPLRADVHAVFGGTPLALLAATAPLLLAWRARPGAPGRRTLAALPVAMTLVVAWSLGAATPLHGLLWHLPLASMIRFPGRLNLILVPLLLLALVRALAAAEEHPPDGPLAGRDRIAPWTLVAVAGACWAVAAAALFALARTPGNFTPLTIRGLPWTVEVASVACGAVALPLMGLRLAARSGRGRAIAGALLCGALALDAAIRLRHGTWDAPRAPTPSLARMDELKRESLAYRGTPVFGMRPRGALPAGVPTVGFEGAGGRPGEDRVAMTHASFDRVVLRAEVSGSGRVTYAVPVAPGWRARVDGRDVAVERGASGQVAVPVDAGAREVELRFESPATVAGVAISALAAAVIGVAAAARLRGSAAARAALVALALLVPAAGVVGFWRGLHAGEDLGTRATWVR